MVNIYHSYSKNIYFILSNERIRLRVFLKKDFKEVKKTMLKEPEILGYITIKGKQSTQAEIILNKSKKYSLYKKPHKSIICYAYVGNNSYVGLCSSSWFPKLTRIFIVL